MGIYDRDYYQGESQQPGYHVGSSQASMVTKLIIVNIVVWFADIFVGGSEHAVTNFLAAHPDSLVNPRHWHQLLTYGFAHSSDPIHLIGNMIVLFFLGRSIEALYGSREFLRIYLVALLLGGVVWTARVYFLGASGGSLVGASGAVTTVVILFAIRFPRETILLMMLFPIPAWLLGVLWVAGDLFRMLNESRSNVAFDVHLTGAAFAGAYHYFQWNLGNWVPRGFRFKLPRRKPKLKVHDPDSRYRQLDLQADRVLDKLHREGEESLSPKERKILEEYSRRMRQKHQ